MRSSFVNEESAKVEHSIVALIVAGVVVHYISVKSILNVDIMAFVIFVSMCVAGYLALKTAKEIILIMEERKQTAYETVEAEKHTSPYDIAPVAFGNVSRLSKYATSTSKTLQKVS